MEQKLTHQQKVAAQHQKRLQEIHREKYLANIVLLPRLKPRQKEYLQVAFTLIALIVAAVFAINPTITTIVDLQKKLDDTKKLHEQFSQKITNLSQLNTQYNAMLGDLPKIDDALPATDQTEDALAQIQALAQEHHLTITSISASSALPSASNTTGTTASPTPVVGLTDASQITITCAFTGTYDDMLSFSNDVINFQRIVTPGQIAIANDTGNNLTLTMQLTIYYQ